MLWTCKQVEPPAPEPSAEKEAPAADPTEEQERAFANPLHRKHLEHHEPLKCADCHRIAGGRPPAQISERCVDCHWEELSTIHTAHADDRARDCLACHEFLGEEVDPWACGRCHAKGTGMLAMTAQEATGQVELLARQLPVHAEEACKQCHVPHEQSGLRSAACSTCHEEQTTRHAEAKVSDPEQCLQCHQPHQPAIHAARSCRDCHAAQARPSALFRGHDECVTCHTPHAADAQVKPCASCHSLEVLGAGHTQGHERCNNCHSPHDVRSTARQSCVGCHSNLDPQHPVPAKQGPCVGCHAIHPVKGHLVDALACSSCHSKAKNDSAFHARGVQCQSCHKPHEFILAKTGSEGCLECHGKAPQQPKGRPGAAGTAATLAATRISPAQGHQDCRSCHANAHKPRTDMPSCTSCHAPEARTAPQGHDKCTACHTPHEGQVKASCVSCHEGRAAGHHAKAASDCLSCHRAHGPKGPEQPKACITCHDKPLPGLHAVAQHRECQTCHDFHASAQAPLPGSRNVCVGPCHAPMRDHVPEATSCEGCHIFERGP